MLFNAIDSLLSVLKILYGVKKMGMDNLNATEPLQRFLDAQKESYDAALMEIMGGRKRTHWMWYIFPQVEGLGLSETSRYYAITGRTQADQYLKHPILGPRLVAVCRALMELATNDARMIFGQPDDMKLRSSMTLFSLVPGADPIFRQVLEKFFGGEGDAGTMARLL